MWLGRPGALVELPGPTGEADMPMTGPALHELLDGYAVDYSGRTHRSYAFTWEGLGHDDAAVIEAYATRQRGVGPFAMLLPETRRNLLAPEQATAGDAPAADSGGSVAGAEQLALSTAQSRLAGGTSWLWTLTHPLHSGFLDYDVPVAGWHGWPTPEALSWAFSAYVRPGSGDTTFDARAVLQWLDAAGAVVSTSNGTYTAVAAGSWVRVSVAATAPAGAVYVRPRLQVDATDLTGGLADTFTRSSTDSLGTATTGQTYTLTGTAADFDVNGSRATVALSATNTVRRFVASGPSSIYRDDRLSMLVPVVPTGAGIEIGLVTRFVDASNFLLADLLIGTDSSITLRLRKTVGGVQSTVDTVASGITHGTGKTYRIRAQAVPDAFGSTFRAKAWDTAGSEPASWMLSQRVDDAGLQAAGVTGGYYLRVTGNSNASPVTAQFDDLTGTATAAAELYVDDAMLEPGAASALTHLPGVGCRRVSLVPDSHVMPTTDYHTYALSLREVG